MTHPIESVLVDDVDVSKAAVRSYARARNRVRVADADEVRATDFSGQLAGLYVSALGADFNLDTSDTTTADNGADCIRDAEGNGFFRVSIDTTETQRLVTAAGAVTVIAADADIIVVKKTVGAATTVNLPSADDRTRPVKIVDGKGDALTNNITVVPSSGESIAGTVDYNWIIDSNGGSVRLTPLADGSGWIV
jgi:hypothetical protein